MKPVKNQMFYAALVAAFLMVGLTAVCFQAHGSDTVIYPVNEDPIEEEWLVGGQGNNPCAKFQRHKRYVGCRYSAGECRFSQATPGAGATWVPDVREYPECTWDMPFDRPGYGNICCVQ